MSINGVSTNYYSTAYANINISKSTETSSFADTIAEKAETVSVRDYDAEDTFSERTRITEAWDKTLEETGIDPFPMDRISTALVILFENGQRWLGPNFPEKQSIRTTLSFMIKTVKW